MNAPERHRSYQLDEGQARMTYEPDQRVASAGTCVEITSASGEAPSSRCRIDGVEDDATIQHEHAVKF